MSSFVNGFLVLPLMAYITDSFQRQDLVIMTKLLLILIRFLNFHIIKLLSAAGNSRNSTNPQVAAKGGFDMLTVLFLKRRSKAVNSVPTMDLVV
jgi:hypothetical protein